MSIFLLLLISIIQLLGKTGFGSSSQVASFSLLSLRENTPVNDEADGFYSKYNVTEKIPRLFVGIHPLELNPSEDSKDSHLFKYSNTSMALDCYQKLPQYSIIVGLLKEYSYFLSVYYRLKCDDSHDYNDGSKCGDIPYMIDLLENKAEILVEKKNKKKYQCFAIESNIVSLQSRFYGDDGFVGRKNDTLIESEFLLVEQSFLRRVISEYERLLVEKTISYELYCISKLDYKGNDVIDCYRLRQESWILEHELISISEEYFKRTYRFKRLDDFI
ncbi:hypothetical protein OIY81_2170 [Cryptosporidium canis]|uniref:Signal peptide-containing protein n=1 Tax=Cryptosporidium canis TaxID=195482 RepID=A0ABQ8P848_9CRYT|nr:hypothetical protein OIY81_2170 [Cryptosporidium canis]KAJ1611797.1 hypothetical protein OJ252_1439 [Cryptosporidium canis]